MTREGYNDARGFVRKVLLPMSMNPLQLNEQYLLLP
jgi:hypothetical protein